MNETNTTVQPDLQARIQAKIAEIDLISNDIPGVIIIHNLLSPAVEYMSQRGLDILGVSLEDLKNLGQDYFDKFFNPEDAKEYTPKVLDLLQRNIAGESFTYFQQVRPHENAEWVWYLSASSVILRDDAYVPLLSITIAQPIDSITNLTNRVDRLLEENLFLKKNFDKLSLLGKREKEVLRYLTKGYKNTEIADKLFITLHTVQSHRKSIKKKLGISSNLDLHRFAELFEVKE